MSSVEMPRKYVPPPLELVKSRIEELLPPAAKEEIDGGAVLIDVRDPERFEAGHLQGAVNVPAGESARDAMKAPTWRRSRRPERAPMIASSWSAARATARRAPADALQNEHNFKKRGLDHRRIEALERARVSR